MRRFLLLTGLCIISYLLYGQLPVEIYAGHKRAGVDIMWFRNIRSPKDSLSHLLFFSRNRASVDYDNKALLGSTNALSYNFDFGLGLVAVGSLNNTVGIRPKAGIQYYKRRQAFSFFGWIVCETLKRPSVELFGLLRYQPAIIKNWSALLQAEFYPVWQPANSYWSIIERFRVGPKYKQWSWGIMTDLQHTGNGDWMHTQNAGGFLRYDF